VASCEHQCIRIFKLTNALTLDTDYSESRLTNDGNAILREIEVAHPAAKNMIELSRTQDEEVGDGTTSVIILGTWYQVGHALGH